MSTTHISGTAAVASGSTTVTGVGSLWKSARLKEGDLFSAKGLSVRIASITNNTTMVLAEPWPGATLPAGSAYEIRFAFDGERGLSALTDVMSKLNAPIDAGEDAIAAAAAAEQSATDANTAKVAAQTAKTAAETARDASIAAKTASETARDTSNTKAGEAAASATAAGTAKTASETARDASIAAKTASETAKTASETARDASVAAKTASETAKTASETARDASIAAKDLSVTAKTASETAKTASETARDASITAKDASVAAQTAAEGARDTAQTHRNDAQTAKTDAVAAAGTATTKAGEAAQSATDAAQSLADAEALVATLEGGPVASVAGVPGPDVSLAELNAAGVALTTELEAKIVNDFDPEVGSYPTDKTLSVAANMQILNSFGPFVTSSVNALRTEVEGNLADATTALQAYADAKVTNPVYGGPGVDYDYWNAEPTNVAPSVKAVYQLADDYYLSVLAEANLYTDGKISNAPNWAAPSTSKAPSESATSARIEARIAALIASAPGLLDTLDEIAAALGDDPNFSTTMLNALNGKQPLDANITSINSRVYTAGQMLYWTADETTAVISTTAYGRSLLNAADAAAARTLLALGTMATATAANYAALSGAAFTGAVSVGSFTLNANGAEGGEMWLKYGTSKGSLLGTEAVLDTVGNVIRMYDNGTGFKGFEFDLWNQTIKSLNGTAKTFLNTADAATVAGGMTFTATASFTGGTNIEVASAAPRIRFTDTDNNAAGKYWWWYLDGDVMFLLRDSDTTPDANWNSPHPLQVNGAAQTALLFGQQILTANVPTMSTPTFNNGFNEELSAINVTGAYTIDTANGAAQNWTLTGNSTITMPANPPSGYSTSLTIGAFQDATGGRTLSFGSNVRWDGDVAPTLTGTANRGDILCFTYMRGLWFGSVQNSNVAGA